MNYRCNAKLGAKKALAGGLSLAAAAVLIAGCQAIPVEVPEIARKEPVEIKNRQDLAPMKLDRIGFKIRRGEVIGQYTAVLWTCGPRPGNLFWNSGRILSKDLEFEDAFYEEMINVNFNVVGNPSKLFSGVADKGVPPAYVIGGQIEDIKMKVCDELNFWTGLPLGRQSGEGALTVRWQVFSMMENKVVYETTTSGSTELEQGVSNGEMLIIMQAFAEAAANLAADTELVKLLSDRNISIAEARDVRETEMRFDRMPVYSDPIAGNIDKIRLGVVTIDGMGFGHGSGFFISPTLILTNFHVVENAQIVRVKLLTGRKVLGEVIRRHPKRDVALIQVEEAGHLPIPIRTEPLKVTEEIFAVGSPLDKSLSGTVTKGIVSKFTSNKFGM